MNKLLDFFKKYTEHPLPPPVQPRSLHLEFLYGCSTCNRASEGAHEGKCKLCNSPYIFHVKSMYEHVRNKADQRLKVQETIREAERKKQTNVLDILTQREPPPKDAA